MFINAVFFSFILKSCFVYNLSLYFECITQVHTLEYPSPWLQSLFCDVLNMHVFMCLLCGGVRWPGGWACVCLSVGSRRLSVWIIDEEMGAMAKLKGRKAGTSEERLCQIYWLDPQVGPKHTNPRHKHSLSKPLQLQQPCYYHNSSHSPTLVSFLFTCIIFISVKSVCGF